jgi:hypothetical protein
VYGRGKGGENKTGLSRRARTLVGLRVATCDRSGCLPDSSADGPGHLYLYL